MEVVSFGQKPRSMTHQRTKEIQNFRSRSGRLLAEQLRRRDIMEIILKASESGITNGVIWQYALSVWGKQTRWRTTRACQVCIMDFRGVNKATRCF